MEKRIKGFAVFGTVALTMLVAPLNASASGDSCKIEKSILVCAEKLSNGAQVLDAMANPDTLKMLEDSRTGALVYPNGYVREDFRRSLEKNRKSMLRYAKRALRQFKRRRLGADEYETIRSNFKAGMEAYHAGMNLYREGTWRSSENRRTISN